MKCIILSGLMVLASVAVYAKYDTLGLPTDGKDYSVGIDVSPALIKGIDIWSTKANAQVKISRVRSVTAYTNVYDISIWYEQEIVQVIDKYQYYYTAENYSAGGIAGKVFTSTNATDDAQLGTRFYMYPDGKTSGNPNIGLTFYNGSVTGKYVDPNGQGYLDISYEGTERFPTQITFNNYYVGFTRSRKPIAWHYQTNSIPHYVTNSVKKVVAGRNFNTNVIMNATCANGFISHVMTNDLYLVFGDVICTEGLTDAAGTATMATMIYER